MAHANDNDVKGKWSVTRLIEALTAHGDIIPESPLPTIMVLPGRTH